MALFRFRAENSFLCLCFENGIYLHRQDMTEEGNKMFPRGAK